MSTALAIAAVTRILRNLLNDELVEADVSSLLDTAASVTTDPPDKVVADNGTEEPTLNLFLHQITPNAAMRNMDLPTRSGAGALTRRPTLAVNLHYLLTAYGANELHREILLGHATLFFHETAILQRAAIRAALDDIALDPGITPALGEALRTSRLADQIEHVKLTQETISTDDMSKIWTAVQSNYRPTVAYEVSVLLMEREQQTREAPPVLTRGPGDPFTGRDRGIPVSPDILPPLPYLTAIVPPGDQPSARLGDTVRIRGHHLNEGTVRIRFIEPESRTMIELDPVASPAPTHVDVALPPDPPVGMPTPGSPFHPATWRAGFYQVLVHITKPGGREELSNIASMLLAPRITNDPPGPPVPPHPVSVTPVPGGLSFAVDVSPPIRSHQNVSLILGDQVLSMTPFDGAPRATVDFVGDGLESGSMPFVRLRVDGVDSHLIDRQSRPPRFDPSQRVAIP